MAGDANVVASQRGRLRLLAVAGGETTTIL